MKWLLVLAATGFLAGTQVQPAEPAFVPVQCDTQTVRLTLSLDRVTYRVNRVTRCSNGKLIMSGWSK